MNNINPCIEDFFSNKKEKFITADLYKVFSILFMYPNEKTYSELKSLLPSIYEVQFKNGDSNCNFSIKSILQTLSTIGLEKWQEMYIKTFEHISTDIPLYESNYFSNNIFKVSERLADISAFYKAFGLKVAEQTKEKLDHISIELEFLGYLTIKEIYAQKEEKKEEYKISAKARKNFIKDHFGRWAPTFAQNLINRSPTTFYKEVGVLFRSFLDTIKK